MDPVEEMWQQHLRNLGGYIRAQREFSQLSQRQLANLTDLGGDIGLSPVALPGSESANGTTGIAWVYERTAISGASPATR